MAYELEQLKQLQESMDFWRKRIEQLEQRVKYLEGKRGDRRDNKPTGLGQVIGIWPPPNMGHAE